MRCATAELSLPASGDRHDRRGGSWPGVEPGDMNEREIVRVPRGLEPRALHAADAARAEAVVDARALLADGAIVRERGIDTGAGVGPPALTAQHVLERGEAEEHVAARGRISHGADAPDSTLELAEGGADLDSEILDEPAAHAQLVDSLGHDDRREKRQSVLGRLLAEQRETERLHARAQGVTVPMVTREACGPALFVE